MADPALLAEAYKRGLLPPDKKAAYEEAMRRGLVGGDQNQATPKPAVKPTNRTMGENVLGFMSTLNRSLLIGDEISAGATTARNVLTGRTPLADARGDFDRNMAREREQEATYSAEHPVAANVLARGIGNSALMAVPGAKTVQGGTLAGNMARGALGAATAGAAYGLADAGTIEERGQAARRNALSPVTLAIGAGAGALATPKRAPPAKKTAMVDTVERFDKAGVTPSLVATKGQGAASVTKAVAENPIAGIPSRMRMDRNIQETAASAERTAGKFGQAGERGAVGDAVQEGVKGFNARFSQRASKLYDSAFDAIDAGQSSQLATTKNAADLRNARMANFGTQPAAVIEPVKTASTLRQMSGRVNSQQLSKIITDPRVASIADALESGGRDVRFGDLRALRTWVREAQKNETLRQGIDAAGLQRMEGALTDDIITNAEKLAGPQAARRLRQADQFYRLGSQRIEGALQNFVGKGSAAPKAGEATYDLIIRAASDKGGADAARLLALKKSLTPEEWGDVSATAIAQMGKPTAGAADLGDFSVSRFVTGYESLSGRGKAALFGTGDLRREIENLVSVASDLKGVERASNASKTAVGAQAVGTIAGLANPSTTVPTAGLLTAMGLTGEAMTNPKVVRALAKKIKDQAAKAATGPASAKVSAPVAARLERLGALAGSQPERRNALAIAPR